MRKTQKQILYSGKLPVHTAVDSCTNPAVSGHFSLMPYNMGTASRYKHYTTTKNHKSISLPASNENTG